MTQYYFISFDVTLLPKVISAAAACMFEKKYGGVSQTGVDELIEKNITFIKCSCMDISL